MMTVEQLKKTPGFEELSGKSKMEIYSTSKLYRQQLTHQTIQGRFLHVKTKKEMPLKAYKAITLTALRKLPFPKFITGYLSENEVKAFER